MTEKTALTNVKAVLEEDGASWDDVMMIRVYLADVDHFAEMNAVYDSYFEEQGLTAPPGRPHDGLRRPARRTPHRDRRAGRTWLTLRSDSRM